MRLAPVLAVSLFAASNAFAVPMVISHQGRLLDSDNTPVTGERQFVFTLHKVETDPTQNPPPPVWTRTVPVMVTGGSYAVLLGVDGTGDPLDSALFATEEPLFLQVKVETVDLRPRLRIGSVPYAMYAGSAASALVAKDVACAGPCISASELEGQIPASKIAAGPGSALDAETLGGKHATDFVQNGTAAQAGAHFAVEGGAVSGALTAGSLSVGGDAALTGKITTARVEAGTAAIAGDAAITGKVTTARVEAGTAAVSGDAGVTGKLAVGGDAAVTGKVTAARVEVGTAAVSGDATITGQVGAAKVDATQVCIAGDCRASWATASQWTSGAGSALSYVAGNVGIGTTTPSARLTIGGGNLVVDANAGSILLNGTGVGLSIGATQIGTTTASDFFLRTNSQDRLTIQSGGNVGIGLTGPTSKLEVAGTISSTTGGFKFPDGTTKATGTLDAAGVVRSDGGNASGSSVNMLTLNLNLTGKAGKWIHLYGGTAIAENGNTSNTAIVRLIIDNNAGATTTVAAQRQGMAVYSQVAWDGNSTAAMWVQGYFQIPAAYAVANATIKLNGGIDGGSFYWGDQPSYTNYDGENAGGTLGYAIF